MLGSDRKSSAGMSKASSSKTPARSLLDRMSTTNGISKVYFHPAMSRRRINLIFMIQSSSPGQNKALNRKLNKHIAKTTTRLVANEGRAKQLESALNTEDSRNKGRAATTTNVPINSLRERYSTGAPATTDTISRGSVNIRGTAGPYTVIAENFAPGTTAGDIQSVMQATGGDILSCVLLSRIPRVIAEVVFADKLGAQMVVEKYHNQKADGRRISVVLLNNDMNKASAAVTSDTFQKSNDYRGRAVNESTMDVDDDHDFYREERQARQENQAPVQARPTDDRDAPRIPTEPRGSRSSLRNGRYNSRDRRQDQYVAGNRNRAY